MRFGIPKTALIALLLATASQAASNTFTDLVQANGGVVPQPFESLMKKLDRISITLIPDSRSRQRPEASFINPRIVAALGLPDNNDPPTLFLGYAPAGDAIEVIAWNRGEARFDFMEVTGYASAPKLREVPRAQCVRCHQNEAPIFPRFPWSETLFNDQVTTRIVQARGGQVEYHGIPYAARKDGQVQQTYLSFDPAKIDRQVRTANRRVQSARLCSALCGSDLDCRRDLLLAALVEPHYQNEYSSRSIELRKSLAARFQSRAAGLPADGFAYPSSLLPDRNPIRDSGAAVLFDIADREPLRKFAEPDLFPLDLLLHADLNYEDRLSEFVLSENRGFTRREVKYEFGEPGDPSTLRPRVAAVAANELGRRMLLAGTECIGFTPAEQLKVLSKDLDRLAAWSASPEASALVSSWPVDTARLVQSIEALK